MSLRYVWLRPLTRPTAAIGALLVGGWLVVAVLSRVLAPYDPLHSMVPLMTPGAHAGGNVFWLGTDALGRDVLSRLIYGARTVVVVATVATLTAYAVGIITGLLAGYFRGAWTLRFPSLQTSFCRFPFSCSISSSSWHWAPRLRTSCSR
jgi:ABC-type dipeptide/oligopeptide/nickel transport system permease subunit